MSDPVCGNCGHALSEHQRECETYFCYPDTNGDTFDTEPTAEIFVAWLEERDSSSYDARVKEWKDEHGHPA